MIFIKPEEPKISKLTTIVFTDGNGLIPLLRIDYENGVVLLTKSNDGIIQVIMGTANKTGDIDDLVYKLFKAGELKLYDSKGFNGCIIAVWEK